MSELNKIQPAQRILPPVQDQNVNQKKKNSEQEKRKQQPRQEHNVDPDARVDEYI